MDPQNQPQFNPKIPISEVLKQEQAGYTPSVPSAAPTPQKISLTDVVDALRNNSNDTNNTKATGPILTGSPIGTKIPEVAPLDRTPPPPSAITIIKTYRSDAAEAAKSQQESVAKIAMAQESQRRSEGEEIGATKPKRNYGLLLIAIMLIALGAAAIPAVQYELNQKKVEVPIITEKTIVPFDHQEILTLDKATREDFLAALNDLRNKQPAASTIEYIKVLENILDANNKTVTQQIAPDTFAGLIGPNMPSALARSFDSEYMFAVENPQNSRPFILFKTSAYAQTFANMLKWESRMITDLSQVLNISADAVGKPFTDRVIISKDVRAVTATDGTILFLYGFLDNQTLIITTDQQTFQDINTRYVAGKFVQ